MSKDDSDGEGVQTRAIHAGKGENRTRAVTPPIWQTTTFAADSSEHFAEIASATRPAEFYTRYGNPTHKEVEATVVALEGGEAALLTSSGMGAIFTALMSALRQGDHVVAQTNHYAGAMTLLDEMPEHFGVEVTLVDQTHAEAFAGALRPNTRVIYAESPTNPLMQITDLRAVAEIARRRSVTTIVDNTFATPVNQRPLELGCDVVVHSATKYLGGHSDVLLGAVVARAVEDAERLRNFRGRTGIVAAPDPCWLLLRSLKTLPVRMERITANAQALVQKLQAHPAVEVVRYPGFGGLLSFDVADPHKVETSLRAIKNATSLGGTESVLESRARWEGDRVPAGLLRLSVGLEDPDELWADLEQALT